MSLAKLLDLMHDQLELEGIEPSWAEVARRLGVDVRTLIRMAAQDEVAPTDKAGELLDRWNGAARYHRIEVGPNGDSVTVILGVLGED